MIKRTPNNRAPGQPSRYAKRKKLATLSMERNRRAAAKRRKG